MAGNHDLFREWCKCSSSYYGLGENGENWTGGTGPSREFPYSN